jgi:drug/metabolite transporter (DMT)-like permease
MPLQLLSFLLLLGAIWGGSFAFMQVAVKEFPPLALIEVRVAIGAVLLATILAMRSGWSSLRGHWKSLFVLGALNSAIPFSLFAFAAKYQTAGLSSVLNSTAPLFGAAIAFVWLKERLQRLQILGLSLGFVGVLVLVTSKSSVQGSFAAIVAGLIAAFLYGVSAHFSKRYLKGCTPLAIATGSLIGASLLLLPLIPWNLPDRHPTLMSWGCAIALGVLCTGIAYLLYFQMLVRFGTSASMTVAYLIPVFGVLWGALFLSEPITPRMLLGGAIVLLGTGLVTRAAK